MNSGLIHLNGYIKSSVQPDWQKQFDEWRELLARCGHKPSRRRVHALRVSTLRLKAEVDFWLLDQDVQDPIVDAAKSWRKQADKVRKALSPVRDTDVYLDMLTRLRAAGGSAGNESHLTPNCSREIEKLESRLQEKRQAAEEELFVEIKKRQARLDRSSRRLQEDLGKRTEWTGNDRVRVVRGLIAGLATDIPGLSAENMHEFRKRAKMARYLSEVAAKQDAHAARQAALLKKMQNAAGKWHDWQTLAFKAEHILGTGEGDGLVKLLNTLAEDSLKNALELCRRVTAQLLNLSARRGVSAEELPPKKPVRRAEIEAIKGDKRYA